ncbi:DNA polymerase III subunit delta [Macrococcus armenti]|uniref:DNA polymerase III subunit delta n=1 Tax=Macrococcus armenti TaxID=2875764 RepID=UPI001CCD441F|nr:DNA polymerase III subunit delta [Macrococcus armenti]UBH14531.1 DNA polymerase III subunit delta [Macrococcus armenti]UBH16892.1 DNA polymerase III subunit delta [Macrococcus armenti]UBH19154.1 DNA polymerase III subunit delta [Macrococcus armenti]
MRYIYLIHGSTKPLVEAETDKLLAKLIGNRDEFNLSQYDMKELPFETMKEDAMTIPFLSDAKAIVIHNAFVFTGEKVKTTFDINIDEILKFIEGFEGPNYVIFTVYSDKLDERKKIVKKIKANHDVRKIEPLDEQGMKQVIKTTLNENFKDIKEDALNEMIGLTGIDYGAVMKELDKLVLYSGDAPVITKSDVSQVVSRSLEQNVFLLTDYITTGKKTKAIHLLKDLIHMKEEPIKLLALITSQYRLYYQVKILAEKGYSEQQIAREVKVHPYRVKLSMRKVRQIPLKHLLEVIDACAEADYELKSSYMDKVLILELFILKV